MIQIFFLAGPEALNSLDDPDLQVHEYALQELYGLCKYRSYLEGKYEDISSCFKILEHGIEHSELSDEKDFLITQYDQISSDPNQRLSAPPSNEDYTQLACASFMECGIATLEKSLNSLAKIVLGDKAVFTIQHIIKIMIDKGILSIETLQKNYSSFPENLRADDKSEIDSIIKNSSSVQ